jgi:anti-repressor protein
MNELIQIDYEGEKPTVRGRKLHAFLEVKEKYTEWFKRMCDYGFVVNRDFILLSEISETNNPKNPSATRADCETNDERYGSVNSYLLTAWNNFLHPVE